jgi:hypothetical protein
MKELCWRCVNPTWSRRPPQPGAYDHTIVTPAAATAWVPPGESGQGAMHIDALTGGLTLPQDVCQSHLTIPPAVSLERNRGYLRPIRQA